MSESRKRALQRAAATGDIEARTRLLRERLRHGEFPERQLELAAHLGDPAGIIALGRQPPVEEPSWGDSWFEKLTGYGLEPCAWVAAALNWCVTLNESLRVGASDWRKISTDRYILAVFGEWIRDKNQRNERALARINGGGFLGTMCSAFRSPRDIPEYTNSSYFHAHAPLFRACLAVLPPGEASPKAPCPNPGGRTSAEEREQFARLDAAWRGRNEERLKTAEATVHATVRDQVLPWVYREAECFPAPRDPAPVPTDLSSNGARRVYRILAHLAACDGELHPAERSVLAQYRVALGLEFDEASRVERQGIQADALPLGRRPTERRFLWEAAQHMVNADGRIAPEEADRLAKIAKSAGIDESP